MPKNVSYSDIRKKKEKYVRKKKENEKNEWKKDRKNLPDFKMTALQIAIRPKFLKVKII